GSSSTTLTRETTSRDGHALPLGGVRSTTRAVRTTAPRPPSTASPSGSWHAPWTSSTVTTRPSSDTATTSLGTVVTSAEPAWTAHSPHATKTRTTATTSHSLAARTRSRASPSSRSMPPSRQARHGRAGRRGSAVGEVRAQRQRRHRRRPARRDGLRGRAVLRRVLPRRVPHEGVVGTGTLRQGHRLLGEGAVEDEQEVGVAQAVAGAEHLQHPHTRVVPVLHRHRGGVAPVPRQVGDDVTVGDLPRGEEVRAHDG